jgi:hypothetical protein
MSVMTMTALGGVVAAATLSGCAAMNKTRSGNMTVSELEQAAKTEAKEAREAEACASAGLCRARR